MVRFERQPPGTALTRSTLSVGALLAALAGWLTIARRPEEAALAALGSAVLLLIGGHRANHGAGGPSDRMLDELLDRVWDGAVLGRDRVGGSHRRPGCRDRRPGRACASARCRRTCVPGGRRSATASRRATSRRGLHYGLVVAGLGLDLAWVIWVAAGVAALAVIVRTSQVAREERA